MGLTLNLKHPRLEIHRQQEVAVALHSCKALKDLERDQGSITINFNNDGGFQGKIEAILCGIPPGTPSDIRATIEGGIEGALRSAMQSLQYGWTPVVLVEDLTEEVGQPAA